MIRVILFCLLAFSSYLYAEEQQNIPEKKYERNLRLGLGSSYLFQGQVPSFKYGFGVSSRYEFILNPKFRLGIHLSLNRSPEKSYQMVYGLILQHHFPSLRSESFEPYVSYGLLMQLMVQRDVRGYGTAHDTRFALGTDFELIEKPFFIEMGYNFSRLKYFTLPDIKWDHLDVMMGWSTLF